MPLISVIVPVYKVESVLHYCINSILSQTFTDFELILIDDGSPDNSGRICDDYALKDSRINVVHKINEGVSVARNTGIELAKGKYICFVDSDDYISEYYLEELVNKINDKRNIVLCCYDSFTEYDYRIQKSNTISNKDIYFSFNKSEIESINKNIIISQPWNKLFKKKIIEKYNIRMDKSLSLGEDMLFVYTYISKIPDKEILIINKPLYHYHIGDENSLLNKYREDLFDSNCYLNKQLELLIKSFNLSNDELNLFNNSCFYRMENVLTNTFKSDKSILKKILINHKIINCENFKYWFSKYSNKMNVIYRFFLKMGIYFPIYILQKISEMKR